MEQAEDKRRPMKLETRNKARARECRLSRCWRQDNSTIAPRLVQVSRWPTATCCWDSGSELALLCSVQGTMLALAGAVIDRSICCSWPSLNELNKTQTIPAAAVGEAEDQDEQLGQVSLTNQYS